MPYVVIDLDGTLCNSAHRVDFALTKQWDEFHEKLCDDKPNEDVMWFIDLLDSLSSQPTEIDTKLWVDIIYLTGRPERYREATVNWFKKNMGNADFPILPDTLLMRPTNDFRPDHELKPALLEEFIGSKEKVLQQVIVVLEDRDRMTESWRNYGLKCWQVRAGAY